MNGGRGRRFEILAVDKKAGTSDRRHFVDSPQSVDHCPQQSQKRLEYQKIQF